MRADNRRRIESNHQGPPQCGALPRPAPLQRLARLMRRGPRRVSAGAVRMARIARVSRAILRVRFSHGRVLFDSRNVQKSVTQIIYLGPLPKARREAVVVDGGLIKHLGAYRFYFCLFCPLPCVLICTTLGVTVTILQKM